MTRYSISRCQNSSFGGKNTIIILSVVVVRIPPDSETSPWAQSAVSALVEDRLTASIQVVTKRLTVGVYSSSDKKTIATFPSFQDDLLSASPLEIRPQIRVNVVELMTRSLYISVCLRTRQDTRPISYSSDIGLYSSKIGTLKDVYGKKTSMAKNKYSKGRRVWQRQVWRI